MYAFLLDDSVYFIDTYSESLFRYIFSTDELIQISNRKYAYISSVGDNAIYCFSYSSSKLRMFEIDLATYNEKEQAYSNLVAVGDTIYYSELDNDNSESPTLQKNILYNADGNDKTIITDSLPKSITGIITVKDGWLYYIVSEDLQIIYDTYKRYYFPYGISKVNIETGEVVKISDFGAIRTDGVGYYHEYLIDDSWIYYLNGDYGLIHYEKMSDGDDELRLYRVGINGENQVKLTDDVINKANIFIRGNGIYYTDSYFPAIPNSIYKINKDGSRKEKLFDGDGMNVSEILDVDKDFIWFWTKELEMPDDKDTEIYIYKMIVQTKELTLLHTLTPNDEIALTGTE